MAKAYRKTRKGQKEKKPRNELSSAQADYLVQLIAEGLKEGEINALAASFDEPFQVSAQHLYSYRKSREKRIKEIRQEREDAAITTGLALRAERINKLVKLAERMERDLFAEVDEKIWLADKKAVGQEIVNFEKFNDTQIEVYRKLLDDIAKELGHRTIKTDLTTGGKPIKGYVVVSPSTWGSKDEENENG